MNGNLVWSATLATAAVPARWRRCRGVRSLTGLDRFSARRSSGGCLDRELVECGNRVRRVHQGRAAAHVDHDAERLVEFLS